MWKASVDIIHASGVGWIIYFLCFHDLSMLFPHSSCLVWVWGSFGALGSLELAME